MRNAMKRAIQKSLHIPNDNANQRQPSRGFLRRSCFFLVFMFFVDDIHCRKGISSDLTAWLKIVANKAFDLFTRTAFYRFHCDKTCSFLFMLDSYQNRFFTFGTTSSFSGSFATNVGVVKLKKIFNKTINVVSMSHGCSYFLQNTSRSHPGDIDMLREPQNKNFTFVGCNKLYGSKPF